MTDEKGTAVYVLENPDADTYHFTAQFHGDDNNNEAEGISTAYCIEKGTQADILVDGIPLSVTYGDPAFTLLPSGGSGTNNTYTYYSDNNAVISVDKDGKASIKGAGTAVITVIKAGDNNYNSVSREISVTVAKKNLNIVIAPDNKEYDGTVAATVKKITYSGKVGEDDIYIIDGILLFSDKNAADNKALTASGYVLNGAQASDYLINTINVEQADITKKRLTVSAKPVSINCGQSISDLSVKISGFVLDENENNIDGFVIPKADMSYNSPTTNLVSNIPITVNFTGGNATNNYEFSYFNTTTLTIKAVVVNEEDYKITENSTIAPDNNTGAAEDKTTESKGIQPGIITEDVSGISFDLSDVTFPSGLTSASISCSLISETGTYDEVYKEANELIGNSSTDIVDRLMVYDLKLIDKNGGLITDYKGNIKVMIPISDDVSQTAHIFWYDPDNKKVTDMNAVVKDGYLIFETKHLSYYAVAELKTADESTSVMPEYIGKTVALMSILLVMGLAGYIIIRKHKNIK